LEFNTSLVDSVNNFSGFTIFGNDDEYAINTVYRDSSSNKILHIWLEQNMEIGERINVSYTPGTIQSEDSVTVDAINYLEVQNDLSETKITRGVTNSDGTKVTLTCNKNIKKNSTIDGFTITDNSQGILAIDSFSIQNAQLTLFLQGTIIKEDSVFAAYSGTDFFGVDGIPLSHFEKLVITNNSDFVSLYFNEHNPVVIYPNPNHAGIFNYSIDGFTIYGYATLEINGRSGILVYKQLISDSEGQIDIHSELSPGIYYIKLTCREFINTIPICIIPGE
jgi:hypothetical protein